MAKIKSHLLENRKQVNSNLDMLWVFGNEVADKLADAAAERLKANNLRVLEVAFHDGRCTAILERMVAIDINLAEHFPRHSIAADREPMWTDPEWKTEEALTRANHEWRIQGKWARCRKCKALRKSLAEWAASNPCPG